MLDTQQNRLSSLRCNSLGRLLLFGHLLLLLRLQMLLLRMLLRMLLLPRMLLRMLLLLLTLLLLQLLLSLLLLRLLRLLLLLRRDLFRNAWLCRASDRNSRLNCHRLIHEPSEPVLIHILARA